MKKEIVCQFCGKKIKVKSLKRRYCSKRCMWKFNREKKKLNPEWVKKEKERLKKMYLEKRKLVDDYKLKKGCEICGYKKCSFALVFHHWRKNKEFEMNQIVGRSIEDIKKEMKKCKILCMNCHAELHHKIGFLG